MGCCECSRNTNEGVGNTGPSSYNNCPIDYQSEIEEKNKKIKELEEKLEKKNAGNNEEDASESSSVSSLSSSQSPPDTKINIEFNGEKYEFSIKKRYCLSKVLHKFSKRYKAKPMGRFYYKDQLIDNLSKTFSELNIEDGDNIKLE